MTLETIVVPCLTDNYAYLLRDTASGKTAVVDVPDEAPIIAELNARGWSLDMILITHHHFDHIDGVVPLQAQTGAQVVGAKKDVDRLPPLDIALNEGDEVALGESVAKIIDVSGHTINHIAFHFAQAKALFTADSLMAMGCGRVFEGTMPMMWESLSKLASLPPETLVYSGHEYTQSNTKFALSIDGKNPALIRRASEIDAARKAGKPTVPSLLSEELATNPFLRATDAGLRAHLGMEAATDADVFGEIRNRKDRF